MVKKSKWINSFTSLDSDNQLIVAEAIIDELQFNEYVLNDDEYDMEKSRLLRNFLKEINGNIRKNGEFKRTNDILEKYDSLSYDNKEHVCDEIIDIIVKYRNKQERENKENKCRQEGHIFGKWIHYKWTDYIDTVIDHQHVYGYPVDCEDWERICSRCGFIEKVKEEPQELIDARKERNKKSRIKKLERELKRLKNE